MSQFLLSRVLIEKCDVVIWYILDKEMVREYVHKKHKNFVNKNGTVCPHMETF